MAAVDRDRNLLFGLLALQNGLIDQGALSVAFAAWTGDKGRPLADHLVDLGYLDATRRAVVEAIADLHVQALGGDPGDSLAVLNIGRSTRESLACAGGADLEAILRYIGSANRSTLGDNDDPDHTGQDVGEATIGYVGPADRSTIADNDAPDHTGAYAVGGATSDGQRFRIVRPHAQGGLGAVFVALDSELDREVALKQILDDRADDPSSRFRFLVEAQITGGLEHPGIVPVYGLGSYSDGRPYYAMRFVQGESLKEAIARFHSGKKAAPAGSRELELHKLLRRLLDVCNAIDYAHSRGVIHRDVKPANIILGKHGETLVVDWGVAKRMGRVEPGSESGEGLLMPSSASGGSETLPGSALGTPAYMSPEQAAGQLDRQGPWSDVYSLGATLYSVLTGKPPFVGDGVAAVLHAVQNGEFSAPRKLDPSIDKVLEAVCLKAMATKPEHRYGSARALADDVEHWLADEPVTAYPEQRFDRLRRWLRRHRTWAYAGVASLIGVCLVATIAAVVIEGSRRNEAETRREAERNFRVAQQAVDRYLTNVSENNLLKEQDSVDVRNLRQELLKSALEYYQQFVNQRGHDPRLQEELANAYFRVGQITREIASPQQAMGALRSAETIWQKLAAHDPKNEALQVRLAACQIKICELLEITGDFHGALSLLKRARGILEPLAGRNVQSLILQATMADCLANLGLVLANLESPDEALPMLLKAKTIRRQMVDRYPHEIGYQRSLAEAINQLGYVYYKKLNFPASLQAFHEVQEICESLINQIPHGPKPARIVDWLARSYYNMGTIQLRLGQNEQSLRSFEQSLHYRQALVEAHPSVLSFQEDLGSDYREIGVHQQSARQYTKAFASAHHSLEIFERLVQTHPDRARFRSDLGRSWNLLGVLYDEARDHAKALPAFQQAVAEQERAVAASNDVNEYKVFLIIHLENVGEQYIDQGEVDAGLEYYLRALRMREELHIAYPANREYGLDFIKAVTALGAIQRHAGRVGAARGSFTRARELLEQLAAAQLGDAAIAGRLGAALTDEGVSLADEPAPKLEAALKLLARAVDLLTPLVSPANAEQEDREHLSEALWQLARIDRAVGKSADAVRADARREALWRDRPPDELVTLALKETSHATLIGYGKTPVSPTGVAARELDLDQAASNLQLAVAQGFRDIRTLQSHPDFWILRSRDDLKLLIMDLAFPDRPFGE